MTRISVVTPFYNEQENLPTLRARLTQVLTDLVGMDYEVVLVDDHSTDRSADIAREWAREDSRVQYVRFSRNFGSHAALSAGLCHCTGDCAAAIAADLQDPPETIPALLEEWRAGSDVVWAVRSAREGESRLTQTAAGIYYWLMRKLALPNMPSRGADFLLLDRKVINAYRNHPEKNTTILGLVLWMGFRQSSIEYVKAARHAGASKWTLAKKLKLLTDSIVTFSYAPIRAASYCGILMAISGCVYALVVILGRFTGWVTPGTGFAALMTVLLVGQGMILAMLGILGEYVWRAFDESRGRPAYIVEEHIVGTLDTPDVNTHRSLSDVR